MNRDETAKMCASVSWVRGMNSHARTWHQRTPVHLVLRSRPFVRRAKGIPVLHLRTVQFLIDLLMRHLKFLLKGPRTKYF